MNCNPEKNNWAIGTINDFQNVIIIYYQREYLPKKGLSS